MTLEQKVSYFARSIAHDKYVIEANKHKPHINLDGVSNERARQEILRFHRKALRWHEKLYARYNSKYQRTLVWSLPPIAAINYVFGSNASQAINIAACESGGGVPANISIYAKNGQYLGMFQMGTHERATYATIGYSTPYQQAVAAKNYFNVAGWGPWECKS